MTISQNIAITLSWFLALLGAVVCVVMFLAAGMRTVPHLEYGEALTAFALPTASALIAAILRFASKGGGADPVLRGRTNRALGVSLATGLLILLTLVMQLGK